MVNLQELHHQRISCQLRRPNHSSEKASKRLFSAVHRFPFEKSLFGGGTERWDEALAITKHKDISQSVEVTFVSFDQPVESNFLSSDFGINVEDEIAS
jgi:hypothetical protein